MHKQVHHSLSPVQKYIGNELYSNKLDKITDKSECQYPDEQFNLRWEKYLLNNDAEHADGNDIQQQICKTKTKLTFIKEIQQVLKIDRGDNKVFKIRRIDEPDNCDEHKAPYKNKEEISGVPVYPVLNLRDKQFGDVAGILLRILLLNKLRLRSLRLGRHSKAYQWQCHSCQQKEYYK